MYTFHEELPSVEVYNRLRHAVGWSAQDPKKVEEALPRSVYTVVAKYKNEVIAFARIVGDGAICFHIQAIVVDPQHQGNGIATEFMKCIMAYFEKNACANAYIGVFVGKNLEAFYERYGFWIRPTDNMGPGMMQFWKGSYKG
jgi:GNAT superfamily N-acetyltransferase